MVATPAWPKSHGLRLSRASAEGSTKCVAYPRDSACGKVVRVICRCLQSEVHMSKVRAIPEGYHSLTPYLNLRNCDKAIEYYKKVFGAEERLRMPGPNGQVMHAELKIGDSIVMLSEVDQVPESQSSIHFYVN